MTLDITHPDSQELAATHRAMWALGDYALMAEEVMAPLGPILVNAVGIGPGVRVLDVAAGSGNVPAAIDQQLEFLPANFAERAVIIHQPLVNGEDLEHIIPVGRKQMLSHQAAASCER